MCWRAVQKATRSCGRASLQSIFWGTNVARFCFIINQRVAYILVFPAKKSLNGCPDRQTGFTNRQGPVRPEDNDLTNNRDKPVRKSRDRTNAPAEQDREDTGDDTSGIGRALRSVYDEAVSEDIPADMRDLLGKLG